MSPFITRVWLALLLVLHSAAPFRAEDWTEPVEVSHQLKRCLAYRARWDGQHVVVQADLEPGWHIFAIDNRERAAEKLAGKKSLGIDLPTVITLSGGLELAGPWHQSPPKDFSKPELRWFSWGFEGRALFAAEVKRAGGDTARLNIRGQACSDTTCKNIDVTLSLPLASLPSQTPKIDLKSLVPFGSRDRSLDPAWWQCSSNTVKLSPHSRRRPS